MSIVTPRQLVTALALASAAAFPAVAFDGWHVENATMVEGKGSGWDYVAIDGAHGRLFVGHRKEGLQVFDLATHKLVKVIGTTASDSSNGATLIPEFDLGVSYNENGTITPFKLSTLDASPSIKIGEELDATHYDPASKRLVANMGSGKDGTDLIVLDVPSLKRVGTIKVTAKKPEHAEADGKGGFFLASRDESKVYRLDTTAMKVTAEWPTPGCAQTNGLALDATNRRIFLGCRPHHDGDFSRWLYYAAHLGKRRCWVGKQHQCQPAYDHIE